MPRPTTASSGTATQKLADLIVMQVQMESAAARKKLGRKAKAALIRIANGEAKARVSDGSVNIAALPSLRLPWRILTTTAVPIWSCRRPENQAPCSCGIAMATGPGCLSAVERCHWGLARGGRVGRTG